MKHYLALGLLSSLLLTSCSVDWNDAKEKKIGELEKQVTEVKQDKQDSIEKLKEEQKKKDELDLSKKRQDCVNKYDKTKNDLKHDDTEYAGGDEMIEIFYSLKYDNCIYTTYHKNIFEKLTAKVAWEYGISAMNGKGILGCDVSKNGDCDIFDTKIKELKGE